jgi:hypothetical protein
MIRRMIWLAFGAIGGILGYRRLGRLTRSLSPQRLTLPGRRQSTGALSRRAGGRSAGQRPLALEPGTGVRAFGRDVRAGMAEYMARHPGRSGNSLVGQQARPSMRAIPRSDNPQDGR